MDNATSFSPPQCPIDISASIVGRGVAVEIEDRGLGIDPEPRTRLNAMLAAPPDFGLLTLSEDARLGLFVVARLADRHGVRVTLLESTYGGVQALVLVPNALLVAEPGDEPPADAETDRGADDDGAPGRDGNGLATPARVSTNGRHSDPDRVSRPWDGGAVAHRSSTTTAPDRVTPPRHQPSPPSTPAARPQPPTAAPAQAPAAPPSTPAARPQPPTAAPAQAPAAPPSQTGKPALPERRPGSASAASAASTAAVSAEPAASPPAATPLSAAAGPAPVDATPPAASSSLADAEPDAAATAALPTVMGVAPLPERRPQGHLAKGLRGRPTPDTATAAADDESAEPAAGRTSTAMSALQSGTRRSRKAAPDTKGPAPDGADGSRA